jgi:PAS domain S-box-containing protein
MTVTGAPIDRGLLEVRLRMHRRVLPGLPVGAALVGIVMSTLLWTQGRQSLLLGWLGCLAGALALRAAVGWAHTRAQVHQRSEAGTSPPPPLPDGATWLLRYRLTYGIHGLAWALAAAVLPAGSSHQEFDMIVFAFTAMAGGALFLTSFDLVAALLFAVPALAPLALPLWSADPYDAWVPGSMMLLVLSLAGVAGLRAQRALRASVSDKLEQDERAAEARRHADTAEHARHALAEQHGLMEQLLRGTPQGFWFIDNAGIGTDANPAMCLLLGRPREQIVGHSVFEFFTGPDLRTLQHEIEARSLGETGSYEIGITRPDGTRLHCVNHATPILDTRGNRVGSVGIWTDLTVRRQAEMALRTYELVANSITDMVSVVGEDRVYRMVNDAWCRATGLPREAAIGRMTSDVLPGGNDTRQRALQECIELRQPRTTRATSQLAALAGRTLETTFYPYAEDTAGVRCVVMVTRDITEQVRALHLAQLAEAEQRALLDAFPGHIGRLDANLVYTYANRGLAAMMGLRPDEMVGRSAHELLGEARAAELRRLVDRALAGELVTYEHRHPGGGQHAYEAQITLAPGIDPRSGARAVYGFALDITALKRAEAALIAARDEAERANRAKSQFLSHMSHELRTPLNAILGFGQLLAADARPPLVGAQRDWAREILRGGQHLLELINEILDLGRIEAGRLELDCIPVNVGELVDECLDLVRPLASCDAVRLLPARHAAPGAHVTADRTRLKQVLLTLLGNAIKYNRPGGEVEVRADLEAETVRLAVRDTGQGLTPGELKRLFEPFERLSATASAVEGTGIGLALSRRLVLAMGGTIGVSSEPGVGSTFWVRLARAATAPGSPADTGKAAMAKPGNDARTRPRTVLQIEDNEVNRILMEAMLARLPQVRLLSAALPSEGLRLASQEDPELILLDIQLPEMDGFEVLRHLRASPATRATPVIAVSANTRPSDIDAALAAGFDAYLTKPIDLGRLLGLVQQWLNGTQQARQAAD